MISSVKPYGIEFFWSHAELAAGREENVLLEENDPFATQYCLLNAGNIFF